MSAYILQLEHEWNIKTSKWQDAKYGKRSPPKGPLIVCFAACLETQTATSDGKGTKSQGVFNKHFQECFLRNSAKTGPLSTQFRRLSDDVRHETMELIKTCPSINQGLMTPTLTSNRPVDITKFSLFSFLTETADKLQGDSPKPTRRSQKPPKTIRRPRRRARKSTRPVQKPTRSPMARPVQKPTRSPKLARPVRSVPKPDRPARHPAPTGPARRPKPVQKPAQGPAEPTHEQETGPKITTGEHTNSTPDPGVEEAAAPVVKCERSTPEDAKEGFASNLNWILLMVFLTIVAIAIITAICCCCPDSGDSTDCHPDIESGLRVRPPEVGSSLASHRLRDHPLTRHRMSQRRQL